jgi:RNA polymerase sigma factor (sigma-70 family)
MSKRHDGEEILTELYHRYQVPLRRFVLRLNGGDQQHAEDVVQETMLKAWRNARELRADDSVMPWLATVARRIVIDHRRRRSSRPDEVEELGADLPSADESEHILQGILVADAMRDLTPAHREALAETFLRDRTVNEAAEVLQIPAGTVKSRVYYGLRALRVAFEERGIEP